MKYKENSLFHYVAPTFHPNLLNRQNLLDPVLAKPES